LSHAGTSWRFLHMVFFSLFDFGDSALLASAAANTLFHLSSSPVFCAAMADAAPSPVSYFALTDAYSSLFFTALSRPVAFLDNWMGFEATFPSSSYFCYPGEQVALLRRFSRICLDCSGDGYFIFCSLSCVPWCSSITSRFTDLPS